MIDVKGVASIPYEEFISFRRTVFPMKYSGPVPPGPDAKWSTQKPTTLADNFKRGIKHDPSQFSVFNNDLNFDSWRRDTEAQAKAQGCGDVLDHTYAPQNSKEIELFELQQTFM